MFKIQAAGPNFKSNGSLEPFQNVNVYSLLCQLIEIKCNPSNGTAEIFKDLLINLPVSSGKSGTNPLKIISFNFFCIFLFIILVY